MVDGAHFVVDELETQANFAFGKGRVHAQGLGRGCPLHAYPLVAGKGGYVGCLISASVGRVDGQLIEHVLGKHLLLLGMQGTGGHQKEAGQY